VKMSKFPHLKYTGKHRKGYSIFYPMIGKIGNIMIVLVK